MTSGKTIAKSSLKYLVTHAEYIPNRGILVVLISLLWLTPFTYDLTGSLILAWLVAGSGMLYAAHISSWTLGALLVVDIDDLGMPDYPEESYSIDDDIINIVSTTDTLGGAPRLDGHRTAVYHILGFYRTDHSIKDIAGDEIYPHLSEAQVKASIHYAIDYPEAVERSSKPRDTSLMMDVSFNTKRGGPTLSVFDRDSDEPGAIANMTLGIDDLPDEYDEQDLHSAWAWMHEPDDRPQTDWEDADEIALDEAKQRIRLLIDPYREDELSPEKAAKVQGYRNALAVICGEDRDERPHIENMPDLGQEPLPDEDGSD